MNKAIWSRFPIRGTCTVCRKQLKVLESPRGSAKTIFTRPWIQKGTIVRILLDAGSSHATLAMCSVQLMHLMHGRTEKLDSGTRTHARQVLLRQMKSGTAVQITHWANYLSHYGTISLHGDHALMLLLATTALRRTNPKKMTTSFTLN
jgi:hypothetical protein